MGLQGTQTFGQARSTMDSGQNPTERRRHLHLRVEGHMDRPLDPFEVIKIMDAMKYFFYLFVIKI